MQGPRSLANIAVAYLDSGDFNLHSQLRVELQQLFEGRPEELQQLLGKAGLGEALLRAATRAEEEAAELREAIQRLEAQASCYRQQAPSYLRFSRTQDELPQQERLLAGVS